MTALHTASDGVRGARPRRSSSIDFHHYGDLSDGTQIIQCVLRSPLLQVTLCSYGARVLDVKMREGNGAWISVVLGHSLLNGYVEDPSYMGAVVGRYANRIAKGRFSVRSKQYQVSQNDGENALHGGLRGFDQRVWAAHLSKGSAIFEYTSQDGEEGYPGALEATVRYRVKGCELIVAYEARSSAETPVNLTNHMYFNLTGEPAENILDHVLTLPADRYTPIDATLIPTGDIIEVQGTPMDFGEPRSIGERIDVDDQQLRFAQGYDHNWVLSKAPGAFGLAARVYEPRSRRQLTVSTSEPGLQFYSGNQLGTPSDSQHPSHKYRCGFCLETQHYPDSPNRAAFPSTLLRPDEVYRSHTVYRWEDQASSCPS